MTFDSPWKKNNTAEKPARRRTRDYSLKQDAVLRAAARAFSKTGFSSTSLNEIADDLNITKTTLYYYYTNKDDLLFSIIDAAYQEIKAAFERAEHHPGNGLEKIRVFFRAYIHVINGDFGQCLCFETSYLKMGRAHAKIREIARKILDRGRRLIQAAIDDQSVRATDPKLLALMLFGSFNQTPAWFKPHSSKSLDEIADFYLEIVTIGLLPG